LIQLKKTSDGSHTLFVPELNEHYHSIHGAVQESSIVFIRNGYQFRHDDPVKILEIGFGTGLNTLLTLIAAIEDKRTVHYTTIEKYPLEEEILSALNHPVFAGERGNYFFKQLHEAPWDSPVMIHERFCLTKLKIDLITDRVSGSYNLVYFDAFAPDKQPEMWSEEIFSKISDVTVPGGVLVTYSSKGQIKRILRSLGFKVYLIPGPPGKREVIRAVRNQ
jgi:tRNA U34 5-methylaminomethyl-2-thiouridine-forming methyltransferase MnmC